MLKIYMASDGCPKEAAILVFAHSVKEARKIAYPCVSDWGGCDWIQVRAKLLRDREFLRKAGNAEKMATDTPHYVESPPTCKRCETWGFELDKNGICTECLELEEENALPQSQS
jgi:hypothetical protein